MAPQVTQAGINATNLLRFTPRNLMDSASNSIGTATLPYSAGLRLMASNLGDKAAAWKQGITSIPKDFKDSLTRAGEKIRTAANTISTKLVNGVNTLATGMKTMYDGVIRAGKAIGKFATTTAGNIRMGFGAAAYAHREAQGIAHPTGWYPEIGRAHV